MRLLAALCFAACFAAAAAAVSNSTAAAPSASTDDAFSQRGARVVGLPPLVLCGLGACFALAACAGIGALRRRFAATAVSDARAAAATARAAALMAQHAALVAAGGGAFGGFGGAPPVRGVVLGTPWPPVRGVPAYDVLGHELQPDDVGAPGATLTRRAVVLRCVAFALREGRRITARDHDPSRVLGALAR
jgi:hypothetical protein